MLRPPGRNRHQYPHPPGMPAAGSHSAKKGDQQTDLPVAKGDLAGLVSHTGLCLITVEAPADRDEDHIPVNS